MAFGLRQIEKSIARTYITVVKCHIFLDIASMAFKFSGNILYINLESHGKLCEHISTGIDAMSRV